MQLHLIETSMGTVIVFSCFCLLCTIILVQGYRTVNELEQRVETLESQGAEQNKLISALIKRLDKQEEHIQSQAHTLEKQQLLLNRHESQMKSQSQTLEKQQLILYRQVNHIKHQSQTLNKQQLLLNRQTNHMASQSQTLKEQQLLLNKQENQLKSQSQTLEKQQLLLDRREKLLKSQSQTLEKQQLLFDKQEKLRKSQSQTLEKRQILVQQQANDMQLTSTVQRQTALSTPQESAQKTKIMVSQQQNTMSSPMYEVNADIANVFDTFLNNANNSGAVQKEAITVDSSSQDTKHKRLVLGAEGPVAFHAVIDKVDVTHIGINQNIVFELVMENLGGAYHSQHGVFIAPVNGVYIFSVSILSYINNHSEFMAALKKDGVILAIAFGHGDNGRNDQGSVTVVTKLSEGNEVWVENINITDDSIYGNRFSTFTGCLIYSL